MKITNRKAITLMEIMVTIVIFSLIAGGVYTTFLVGVRSWSYYNESVVLKQEVRRTLFTICQELREAKNVFIEKDEIRGVTLKFYRLSVGDVSYTWTNYGGKAHQIIRINKNQAKILARNISAFSLSQETTNDIAIEIVGVKTQKNGQEISIYLKEKIALRPTTGIMKITED